MSPVPDSKPAPSASAAHPSGDKRFKLLDRVIAKHQGAGSALIEVLHAAQGIFGFLDNDVMIYAAHKLKLPLSTVYGVATFYHFFRLKPNGEHTFVLCMGTACYVKGADKIHSAAEERCGCKFGETTSDGRVSLVSARCVGSCGLAPVAVCDDKVEGKLNVASATARIEAWKK